MTFRVCETRETIGQDYKHTLMIISVTTIDCGMRIKKPG